MHDRARLAADFAALPIPRGGVVVLHSGMRAIGPVDGGADTVIAALGDALGPDGTWMAPTFTTQLIDPYTWPVPPPADERLALLARMPTFATHRTPPHKMGAIAAALWRTPGASRSDHPVTSWCALGPRADALLRDHDLDDPEGKNGPVGRAWAADATVVLLGVDHDANTTVHLAESLLDMPHLRELPDRYPVDVDGVRSWREVQRTTKCSDGFVKLRPLLANVSTVSTIGDAVTTMIPSRDVVRVTIELLSADPTALLCDDAACVHCPTSRRVLRRWR